MRSQHPMTARLAWLFAAFAFAMVFPGAPARALDDIPVPIDAPALDLTRLIDTYTQSSDRIQVSTAPGADGLVRRIEVRAENQDGASSWAVFALTNDSNEQIDRLLVADYHRLVHSGVIWPDLGASRIATITPSEGFRPERQASENADVFLITLDPGATVTFVAELRVPALPQLYLWNLDAYRDKQRNFTLFQGIVIGVSGMLALLLTTAFVVRGTAMFPAAASFAWAVLGYLCIDFGFWHKIFTVTSYGEQVYRAGAEAMLAATLLVFLFAYLHLGRWHVRLLHATGLWVFGLVALAVLAVYYAPVAAGLARLSLAGIGIAGFGAIVFLSLRGFDRAIMLTPTWLMLLVWLFAGGATVTGHLSNDFVTPGLSAGLVMIVLLIAFTVGQHAFSGGGAIVTRETDAGRKALALTGSGDAVWDWDTVRERVYTGPEIEKLLSFKPGTLSATTAAWLSHVHPADREGFSSLLEAAVHQRGGRIEHDLRMQREDGHYVWLRVRARPVLGADGEIERCIGSISDVTEFRNSQERLLHDAVHDNLTGLPNRQLFLDRLETAMTRARTESAVKPTVLSLDIDRFRKVNESVGLSAGDSILLTVARRLGRNLKPQDTLARLSGDQFGIILTSEGEPKRIAALAETVRRALKAPITYADREIFLTAATGLSVYDGKTSKSDELLREAELAMNHAKRFGPDKIEAFKAHMRGANTDVLSIESDLRRAIQNDEIEVLYQPIMRLQDFSVAGFEALLRWNHPKRGLLRPSEFIGIAEASGLIVDLGILVMERAADELHEWQQAMNGREIFASVNVSSRQLIRNDIVNDVRQVLAKSRVAPGSLKLEVTESLVMENPEQAAHLLRRIRDLGAGLSLDDFGTGHSSLSYLHRFPFDTIKVDKSFVQVNGNGARPIILRSIVTMAHDLGMEVVAEGAESDEDAHDLFEIGCEFAQGFFFGEPMNARDAMKMLTDRRDEPAQD